MNKSASIKQFDLLKNNSKKIFIKIVVGFLCTYFYK